MAPSSNFRTGGNAVLLGGAFWALAAFLHPDVSAVELAAAAMGPLWALIHWAYLAADVLFIGGLLLIFRYLARTPVEGHAAFVFALGILAFGLDAVSNALHLMAFPPLLATAGAADAASAATYAAVSSAASAVGTSFFLMACAMVAFLGAALLRAGFPAAVSYAGVAIGGLVFLLIAFQIAGVFTLPAALGLPLQLLVPLWAVAAGIVIRSDARTASQVGVGATDSEGAML